MVAPKEIGPHLSWNPGSVSRLSGRLDPRQPSSSQLWRSPVGRATSVPSFWKQDSPPRLVTISSSLLRVRQCPTLPRDRRPVCRVCCVRSARTSPHPTSPKCWVSGLNVPPQAPILIAPCTCRPWTATNRCPSNGRSFPAATPSPSPHPTRANERNDRGSQVPFKTEHPRGREPVRGGRLEGEDGGAVGRRGLRPTHR